MAREIERRGALGTAELLGIPPESLDLDRASLTDLSKIDVAMVQHPDPAGERSKEIG